MKLSWFSVLATTLFLVGCSPDRTLDSLIPGNSLAVVLVDKPSLLAAAIGSEVTDFPWKALDGDKPWAVAALPASPPGILMALALAPGPSSWDAVSTWARDRGGMAVAREGSYAVLTSPGLSPPVILEPGKQFDLDCIRADHEPVSIYMDMKNLAANQSGVPAFQHLFGCAPHALKDLRGIRLGFNAKAGGLELRLATDWVPGSPEGKLLSSLGASAVDPGAWTGYLPAADGFGVSVSLPAGVWNLLGKKISDPVLKLRWDSVVPLLGSRVALTIRNHPEGPFSWGGAVESRDPQGIRQAIKTLVASGDLQRNFSGWYLDGDTPLVYQDKPDGSGGIRTRILFGQEEIFLGYADQKVFFAGGPGARTELSNWSENPGPPAVWTKTAPGRPALLATGESDGLGAHGSVEVLNDGNVEVHLWVDAAGLKAWEDRLPQALLSWVSGAGGWTRWEP